MALNIMTLSKMTLNYVYDTGHRYQLSSLTSFIQLASPIAKNGQKSKMELVNKLLGTIGAGVIRRPPTGRQANWSTLSTGRQG